MSQQQSTFGLSAYGGEGWSPRSDGMAAELGNVWGACGIDSEWCTLQAVLLHRPGRELQASNNPNDVQMLAPVDVARAVGDRLQPGHARGVGPHLRAMDDPGHKAGKALNE